MNLFISLVYSLLLGIVGRKSFKLFGLITAIIFSFIICYCGNISAFITLVTLFIITIITDKVKKDKKIKIIENTHEKNDKRDVFQIIDNLLISVISIIIYKITNKNIYMILFYISLAISAADTSASGVGILSKKTFNILTLKESKKGLSGNVSILGFLASFLAALIIGVTSLIYNVNISNIVVITIFGFLGAVLDSFIGCFQIKYKCNKCKIITEKRIHCNMRTKYYKGIKLLDNDLVNILSNIITVIMAYIILGNLW